MLLTGIGDARQGREGERHSALLRFLVTRTVPLVTALDLSNYAGLVALGLLTANILLGLLLSVKYNPCASGRIVA